MNTYLKKSWFLPLVILIVLLSANSLRWKTEATLQKEFEIVIWTRDRWTGQVWMVRHTTSGSITSEFVGRRAGSMSLGSGINYIRYPGARQEVRDEALIKNDRADAIWTISTIIVGVWLAVAVVGESYEASLERRRADSR